MPVFRDDGFEAEDTRPVPRYVDADKKLFSCPYCTATRFCYRELQGHIEADGFHAEDKIFYCPGCGKDIAQSQIDEFFSK